MRKDNVKSAGGTSNVMKTIVLLAATMAMESMGQAQSGAPAGFLPKHLAVLRAGNGTIDLHLKQSPIFVDEFAPGSFNKGPIISVAIPTNGTETLFFNGHAATEGMLSRSADGKLLTFAGYGGVNLLEKSGTPSLLDIGRGLCTVDAAGKTHAVIFENYTGAEKMNPRGAVSDGANHFWTCGNASATAYYRSDSKEFVPFSNVPNSRQVKIINGTLYTTLNGEDGIYENVSPGIFSFADDDGVAVPLPKEHDTTVKLLVPVEKPYVKIAGFDLSPDGNTAYTADVDEGIQKYVKADGAWKLAYHFAIPQNIPDAANNLHGCFAVTVDFSGANPVIYATTTEGYGGSVNSNRVVQVVDTGASSVVTTLAQAPSVNIAYRGIAFTPDK
jgi:hypothetical protein